MAAQGVLTTLCYLERDDAYLMLHRVKKKNDVNHDKWIGIGGKFEGVESPEECLLREAKEETGLTLTDYRLRGIVTFISSEPWDAEYMFLYTATGWTGEMQECSEGTLEWVPKKDIEKLNLWEGDKLFFRLMEEDRAVFSLKLRYNKDELVEAVLDGEVLILQDLSKRITAKEMEHPMREFPGAIISISHDRKYIAEVCEKVYELTEDGLKDSQIMI